MNAQLPQKPVLWLIVPCYNEAETLPSTIAQLQTLIEFLVDNDLIQPSSTVLYVDDGSKDDTWNIITQAHHSWGHNAGIRLGQNRGHQNALMAGLETARHTADIMITIDADLQDDIHTIPEMVRLYLQGNDIVYGVRDERKNDTLFKRTSAEAFYKFAHYMGTPTVYNHADFRLMSRRAVDELMTYEERNLYLRGIVPQLGFPSSKVYYERKNRAKGTSKYSLARMFSLAADGITSFSIKPVRMIMTLGMVFVLIALVIVAYIIVSVCRNNNVPGWVSLMLSIWFVGGCILIGMGVLGEYIGKIYFEVKHRPRFNITERLL